MATWYTVEEALTRWGTGAPEEEDMEQLLAVSRQQCLAYAPVPVVLAAPLPAPESGRIVGEVSGEWTTQRLPGGVVQIDVTLTNNSANPTEYWYGGVILSEAFRPAANVWTQTPAGAGFEITQTGVLQKSWGTFAIGETVTLKVFTAAAESDPEPVEDIPAGHREAHYVQACNIHNATLVTPGATAFGPDGMTISVHPLDWHVKQLLRPRTAVPKVR